MKPTPRHWKFADLVAQGVDVKAAAIEAGFSKRTAHSKAWEWVGESRSDSKYPELWDHVQAIREKATEDAVAKVHENLAFLTNVLRFSWSDLVEFHGKELRLKALDAIPANTRSVIKKLKTKKGEGFEIELYSKMDAARELLKVHGAYAPDKHEITGKNGEPVGGESIMDKLSLDQLSQLREIARSVKENNVKEQPQSENPNT